MWQAAGFLGITVDVLIDTYGHHHPDFQADAAEKIAKKQVAAEATKSVSGQMTMKHELGRGGPMFPTQSSKGNAIIAKQA
ncbi:hypothetical protein NKH24_11965 [Mesorhizobium sp. M1300]